MELCNCIGGVVELWHCVSVELLELYVCVVVDLWICALYMYVVVELWSC